MTEWVLLGLLLLAVFGWAITVVLFTRALLPFYNAFATMNRIDKLFTDRVDSALNRAKMINAPRLPEKSKSTQPPSPYSQLSEIFGGPPIVEGPPLEEQPDLEIVQA